MIENQEIVNKKMKELSRSAVGLSRKVLNAEDVFANQEEKWLKRERELLEQMLTGAKAKEQAEHGWMRDRSILATEQT